MNILVIGSGGREHALVWKLSQSHRVKNLFVAPGNPGMASVAKCVGVMATDINGLVRFARDNSIDLTIVGPELPLALGVVDEFHKHGLKIFGPTKNASRIESDKAFARELMHRYGIPAPKFQVFDSANQALKYGRARGDYPLVVKAAGLAGGKGVFIAATRHEYEQLIDELLVQHKLGEAASRIVVEEFLLGPEASIFVVSDGLRMLYLPAAQDHKRLKDRNRGPNTGGMGAYAPYPTNKRVTNIIEQVIMQPTVLVMRDLGVEYKGALYAGLIITPSGPKVLEFNCRFGDPETQAIMPLLDCDLAELCLAVVDNELQNFQLKVKNQWSICVVLTSGGYPGSYRVGEEIHLPDKMNNDVQILHAGTRLEDGKLVTAGGRVLNVVSASDNLKVAKQRVYEEIKKIQFNGMFYRKDIGSAGMKKMKRKRKRS